MQTTAFPDDTAMQVLVIFVRGTFGVTSSLFTRPMCLELNVLCFMPLFDVEKMNRLCMRQILHRTKLGILNTLWSTTLLALSQNTINTKYILKFMAKNKCIRKQTTFFIHDFVIGNS